MKIYHYTKGYCLNSIFSDGFIATETKRSISGGHRETDYVWLTEKTNYPKTALPSISGVPESNLGVHLSQKSVHVDLDKVGNYVGSFFRFGFESTDSRFKKWWYSDERASMKSNQLWSKMESVANKVGDDVRSFWISPHDVALENFSLEIFAGGWVKLISNGSVSDADLETLTLVYSLMESSKSTCFKLGFPAHHLQSPKISETEAFLIMLKKLLGETVSI
jgi:hypothetical protein